MHEEEPATNLQTCDEAIMSDEEEKVELPLEDKEEPKLRRQARNYSRQDLELFDLLDRPVWVFDIERKAMWWANHASLGLWKADTREQLLARDFTDMSEATARQTQEYLVQFRQGLRVSDSWTFYPNGEGPKTCLITMSGMYVEDGRLVMLVEGEMLKAQETIGESAMRAVEMLRHLPVPVSQFDASGHVMDQNPESLHVFGGCNQDAGSGDGNCMTGCCGLLERFVDKELGKRVLDQVVQEGIDFNDEIQQHTKQGIRWFAIKLRRTKDHVNGLPVVLYSARDITALMEAKNNIIACVSAKNDADQANKAKSEFVAVISHEIRTPLHQVLGFLELMSGTNLNTQQTEYVSLMENSASALMSVINDLLDYTKLEAGKMKMEKIPFDVGAVARESLAVICAKTEAKGLSLSSNLDGRIPPLVGDPNRLRQVLLNFFQNAVKFTHEGGITLSLSRLPDDECGRVVLRFVVADTGIGISPEHHRLIFNKYQQAEPSVARHYGGTGLGLAICKIIAETLGGSIGVDSIVGQGSKFWFQIPYETATNKRTIPITPDQREQAPALHILVAEDNKINQKLLVAMLKRLGHSSTVAENGLQAVEAVQKNSYDLILMDVQMPEMDGMEATQIIRRNGWTEDVLPVLGLTADFRTTDLSKYQEIGMNDCIGKPIRINDLRAYLKKAVGSSYHHQKKCGGSRTPSLRGIPSSLFAKNIHISLEELYSKQRK
jgi:signal transduction histidine kinase/ActR/RegA family two-component response regulator